MAIRFDARITSSQNWATEEVEAQGSHLRRPIGRILSVVVAEMHCQSTVLGQLRLILDAYSAESNDVRLRRPSPCWRQRVLRSSSSRIGIRIQETASIASIYASNRIVTGDYERRRARTNRRPIVMSEARHSPRRTRPPADPALSALATARRRSGASRRRMPGPAPYG